MLNALASTMPGYVPPSRLNSLTEEQLWAEWQDTGAALRRSTSTSEVLTIVERRQAYLDELERRDPHILAVLLMEGRAVGRRGPIHGCDP